MAVAQLVRSVWASEVGNPGLIPQSLGLSDPDRKLLERGVQSYLLPGQGPLRGVDVQGAPPGTAAVMERYVSPKIVQVISARRHPVNLKTPTTATSPAVRCWGGLCWFPQACREKHIAAESYLVYSVVCEGVVECSNTMEDYEDTELLPQALAYKTCRQRTYGVLLCLDRGISLSLSLALALSHTHCNSQRPYLIAPLGAHLVLSTLFS